jgi:hypothetical protein
MSFEADQITELKVVYPNISALDEGGLTLIQIAGLKLPEGCSPVVVDALLWPYPRDGYTSRLFLSSKITHQGEGINWNHSGGFIANRAYYAVSWQTNKSDLRLLGMVTAHLQAFTCKK